MPRTKGAKARKPENKATALKEWLQARKIAQAKEFGCEVCNSDTRVHDPDKLVWVGRHRDSKTRRFKVSHGPDVRGMTLDRLSNEVDKCMLVCKRHFEGWLKYDVDRKSSESVAYDHQMSDLNLLLPGALREALLKDGPPEVVKIGDYHYHLGD